MFRLFGSFSFGATDKLEAALESAHCEPKVLILRMRKLLTMDATGLNALEDLLAKLRRKGSHLILSAPHTQPYFMMVKAGFIDELGAENVASHIDEALVRARHILAAAEIPQSGVHSNPIAPAALARHGKVSLPTRDNAKVQEVTHAD